MATGNGGSIAVLYVTDSRSALMSDDDRTPGQLLQEIIDKRGLEKAALARQAFGPKATYLRVHRLTQDRGFNAKNQDIMSDLLALPRGYFRKPDLAARKEEYRQRILSEFKATELGRKASESELRILDSIPFVDDILPLPHFYTLTLLALQNRLTPDQYKAVLADNRALLESAQQKKRSKPTK